MSRFAKTPDPPSARLSLWAKSSRGVVRFLCGHLHMHRLSLPISRG
jgi:hypothetical protein